MRRRLRVERLEPRALLSANQFAIIGDYGSDLPSELAVANLVKSWDPAYIITAGDNNYPNGDAATIDAHVGKYYHEFIGNYKGTYGAGSATNRFFPAIGNHDWELAGIAAYLNYFTLPGNERYYDFVQGPIHFFMLNSDYHEPDGNTVESVQAEWLRRGLMASTAPFQVVVDHHPPFSSGTHGNDPQLNWPFAQWGADAVVSGHDHDYERFALNGIPYFVNGSGGDDLRGFGSRLVAGSQLRYAGNFGAQLVTVSNTELTFDYYSVDGTLIDRHRITSGAPLGPTLSISDASVGETTSSTGYAVFAVTRSRADNSTTTVRYTTIDGSASAGTDYTAVAGTLTFTAGQTSTTISVAVTGDAALEVNETVKGDAALEVNETFKVNLTDAVNATIAHGGATGTIFDDDGSTPGLAQVSFQDGALSYVGTRDAAIRGNTPTANLGSNGILNADGSPDAAALIKWDVRSVPSGSRVQSATITFGVVNGSVESYEIYQLKRNWLEYQVTFGQASVGQSWEVAGAQGASDRGSTVLGSVTASTSGLTTMALNSAGLAMIQSWIDNPAANLGFIIQDYGAVDNLTLQSREVKPATNRPKLTVAFIPPSTPPTTPTFQQDSGADGLVSIEAEHYGATTVQSGHYWSEFAPAGSSGDAAMQAAPNSGMNVMTNYAAFSPRMDYPVNFTKTGTHYIWVRGQAASTADDSLHAGLDDIDVPTADKMHGFVVGSVWTWTRATGDGDPATVNIATAGRHVVNLWMREDGMIVDKIVLTTNPNYVPSGSGPTESARLPLAGAIGMAGLAPAGALTAGPGAMESPLTTANAVRQILARLRQSANNPALPEAAAIEWAWRDLARDEFITAAPTHTKRRR